MSGIHNVERRWTGGIPADGRNPGLPIDVRVIEFATAFGDWDALAVIGVAGEVAITLVQRTVYPEGTGLWGCATCEQWHPVNVSRCPLLGKKTVGVVVGPIYHDGGQVLYLAAECADGTFDDGRLVSGVGVFRASAPGDETP